MKFWKKKQFWGALIGIALLAFCVKDIRPSEIEVLTSRVKAYYLIPAVLAAFLYIIFRALRWRVLISQQADVGVVRSVTLSSAGQVLNIVMPVLTGQVGRLILFARNLGLRKTFVFSTIVLEVVFDAASLIIFMAFTSLAFAFPDRYRYASFIVAGATIVVLAVLYLTLHYQQRLEECGRRHLRHRHPGTYITLKKFIRSFTKGTEMLRSSQHVASTIAWSLASWTCHMLAIYFLFMAFGFDLQIAPAAAIMIINTIILMIPITPGNAGTFEFAVSTSLAAFHVGRSDAVLFALALHLLDLLPVVVLGMGFMSRDAAAIREIKEKHQDEDILEKISEEGTFVEEEQL